MNKSMLTGIAIGVVVATAGGAIAGYKLIANNEPANAEATDGKSPEQLASNEPAYAEVLDVKEVTRTVQTPREVCEDVPVTKQKPVKDENRIVGTAAGAVIGGLLGNQVGGGTGKKLATVAGAAAGGYAGNQVQKNMQDNNTYTEMERRCETVSDTSQEATGYDVSYLLNGQRDTVRMDHRPGDRIPVENGQLMLNSSVTTTQ